MGTADPKLDGRIDWVGTSAALAAQYAPALTRVGVIAYTSDLGLCQNNGIAWVPLLLGSLNPILATLTLTGFLFESSQDNIVAHAGGGQGSATALTKELNRITTVATAGDSVSLPASAAGLTIILINHGNLAMQVFGAGTDTIDDVATAVGVSQMANSTVIYTCNTAGAWYTEGLALSGFVRGASLQTFSATDGVVAHAGGGQGAATPLTSMMIRISTVATAADSVLLPVSASGMDITVTNAAAANACNVFPNAGGTGTETINALAANAAYSLPAGKTAQFICYTPGQWHTLLSA